MKKLFTTLIAIVIVFISCQNEVTDNEVQIEKAETIQKTEKQCFTMSKLAENLANDKSLATKMHNIELHTDDFLNAKKADNGLFERLVNGKIQIPIVFHVIYRTQSENVPLSILQDQVDAINRDFNLQNPNRGNLPSEFAGVEANVGYEFVIEDVIRVKNSKKRSWRPNDSMKFSSSGGSDVVNPQEFLNVWVVNSMPYRGGQILGYAQFPGGDWATDGVVMSDGFISGTSTTLTHEIGHWLNLRHIWGDGGCGASDFVSDTPDADGPTRGCPTYPVVECGSNNMTMNFMDYTDDDCMYMFTQGQKGRMDAVFTSGGFRSQMGGN